MLPRAFNCSVNLAIPKQAQLKFRTGGQLLRYALDQGLQPLETPQISAKMSRMAPDAFLIPTGGRSSARCDSSGGLSITWIFSPANPARENRVAHVVGQHDDGG